MRQTPIFNFVPDSGDELDKDAVRSGQNDPEAGNVPAFEPTRDGWRAYQAWCKQIREDWQTDD